MAFPWGAKHFIASFAWLQTGLFCIVLVRYSQPKRLVIR